MIRYTAIKPIMWGGVIALLMFSFPLQVLFLNPYPALLPYIIVIIIFLLTIKHSNNNAIYRQNKNINNIIYAYISLVLLHNLWQTAAGYITVVDAVSSILIFIFPVSFYYYFSKYATKKEINSVLVVVGICGLISGIYFVLDSYSMMVLGKVNDFSY